MGGSLSSSAKQLAQQSLQHPARKLKPLGPEQLDALNRLAAQDQARMRELPSMEELNTKDVSLDELLNKLGGAIERRDLSPDEPHELSTSGRAQAQMPPARPRLSLRAPTATTRRAAVSADDEPGRLQSYVIKEILEARNAAAAQGKEIDLAPFVNAYGADRSKLLTLMEFNCLPVVGKVATFGHQYAFARPPAWWLRGGLSGAKFVSEPTGEGRPRGARAVEAGGATVTGSTPAEAAAAVAGAGVGDVADDELMRSLMGSPVAGPTGAARGPSAMFGGGRPTMDVPTGAQGVAGGAGGPGGSGKQ